MESDQIHRISSCIAKACEREIYQICETTLEHVECGSPIEALLLVSFDIAAKLILPGSRIAYGMQEVGHLVEDNEKSEFVLYVQRQVTVCEVRVDFLFSIRRDGKDIDVIVECDGHDFHERTKEQAARDRSRDRNFQNAGYVILRFTGSELFRSPTDCVSQIMRWMLLK